MWDQTVENCGNNRFKDYLMVIDTVEILWNLCGIYKEFFRKSMVPQHIMEGQCGIFVEIIRKFGRKSSSTVWNLMYLMYILIKGFNKEFLPSSLTEHPVDHLVHFSVGICVTSYTGCW